jgi:hypothetical protein
VLFILVACVVVNLLPGQHYPTYWFVNSKYYYRTAPAEVEERKEEETGVARV